MSRQSDGVSHPVVVATQPQRHASVGTPGTTLLLLIPPGNTESFKRMVFLSRDIIKIPCDFEHVLIDHNVILGPQVSFRYPVQILS